MQKYALFALAMLSVGAASPAEQDYEANSEIHPSFPCLKSDTSFVSRMVCSDSELTRVELETAQAYFAFKQTMNSDFTQELKALSNARNGAMNKKCAFTEDPKSCIKDYYVLYRSALIDTLSGPAKEEATRPLEEHIALQHKLKDKGYIPKNEKSYGVYGSQVRQGIKKWQKANHRPVVNGLLGDDDAAVLLAQ